MLPSRKFPFHKSGEKIERSSFRKWREESSLKNVNPLSSKKYPLTIESPKFVQQ